MITIELAYLRDMKCCAVIFVYQLSSQERLPVCVMKSLRLEILVLPAIEIYIKISTYNYIQKCKISVKMNFRPHKPTEYLLIDAVKFFGRFKKLQYF